MDIRKKELYEVFADSLEKSRTKEGGLLFDKLFEDIWEHIEPKLGQSLPIDIVSQQRELLLDYDRFQNDFNRRLNDGLSEKIVDDFLANNCG